MKRKMVRSFLLLFLILVSSSVCFAQAVPLPPTNLVAEVNDSSVTLAWTPPVDTSVAGFNVYRIEDGAGKDYAKVNGQLLTASEYNDRSVSRGKSYTYVCKSVNTDGIESAPSNIAGAPKMQMKTSAVVTHLGKPVRIAAPGDVIKYNIDFANRGFGSARNVVIVYAIPKGTTFISGTAKCPKFKARISYFDEKAGNWVDRVGREENVSRVRFTVTEDISPVAKDLNDTASLKVMVNY